MGYFRLFYYISYIFNTFFRFFKRHKKIFVILPILCIFCFSFLLTPRVNAVELVQDIDYGVYSYYDNLCNRAISFLGKYYINYPEDILFYNIKDNLVNDFGYYICLGARDGSDYLGSIPTNKTSFTIIQYTLVANPTKTVLPYDYLNITGQAMLKLQLGSIGRYMTFTSPNVQSTTATLNEFYIPASLYGYKSYNWVVFEQAIRDNDTQAILNLLDEINTDVGDIKDYIQDSPSSSSFSSSDLPSDSGVTDPTENYTDNLFTKFYNVFTREPSSSDNVTVNIPFTNKSFVIPYNYTSSFVNVTLKDLINTFWYFSVSLLIYKDISKKFNKIRSGDIEHLQDTNIKEDIL